jgi:hypothetical protein
MHDERFKHDCQAAVAELKRGCGDGRRTGRPSAAAMPSRIASPLALCVGGDSESDDDARAVVPMRRCRTTFSLASPSGNSGSSGDVAPTVFKFDTADGSS